MELHNANYKTGNTVLPEQNNLSMDYKLFVVINHLFSISLFYFVQKFSELYQDQQMLEISKFWLDLNMQKCCYIYTTVTTSYYHYSMAVQIRTCYAKDESCNIFKRKQQCTYLCPRVLKPMLGCQNSQKCIFNHGFKISKPLT